MESKRVFSWLLWNQRFYLFQPVQDFFLQQYHWRHTWNLEKKLPTVPGCTCVLSCFLPCFTTCVVCLKINSQQNTRVLDCSCVTLNGLFVVGEACKRRFDVWFSSDNARNTTNAMPPCHPLWTACFSTKGTDDNKVASSPGLSIFMESTPSFLEVWCFFLRRALDSAT